MDKNTSISLHLAKVMGLQNIQTAPEQYQVGERVTHELTDIRREIFNPFTNRAQWADVVLWYVSMGNDFHFHTDGASSAGYDDGCLVDHDNTAVARIGASLEIISLATGWAE